MKIAIYSQYYPEKSLDTFDLLLKILSKEDVEIFIEQEFFENTKDIIKSTSVSAFTTLDNTFNLLISIGGDGTILRAITYVKDLDIPIVGVNTGRLGFLATIQTDDIEYAFKNILNKNYKISERSLLSIETFPENKDIKETNFALNEIAISRKNTTSMITVDTKLNNEYLTSYWSDGLIVSTPTGSTGYSLSCGGPVITPDTNSFVLTPIAPHNLSARPLVIPDSTEIELKVDGREEQHLVSLDSRIATLNNNTIIKIKKAPFTIKMLELIEESFLDTLRKKLLWGEDKRN
ncbi:NAD kinase [Oceanihabitans sp. 2_MG-2023]|uniref:NAD kinase n=1 Tax=Oceanihabitans sp. 2_MG-2023 TaxID=3062661 RepID=UPI0026E42F87|nr:NAD kinase [Oceanihabitans sp. 2_MG-2023]MDO6596320.1 NAD kinase [Oceanihabitans sp. 2_MG-2023]